MAAGDSLLAGLFLTNSSMASNRQHYLCSTTLSLREMTRCPFAKEDIVEQIDGQRESAHFTAASAAYLNLGLQPTPGSVRSYLAPAARRG